MRKQWLTAYFLITVMICLLPFAGLLWKTAGENRENRRLAEFPEFREEEEWNLDYLSDLGAYFEDHFAYREEMATADALLRGKLLGTSAADGVIQGTAGWLYYRDSLSDYLGDAPLSDRGIYTIAHTLKLMQDSVENSGRNFLFTIAPNKNSLYGEHMPYYDQVKVSEIHNRDRLVEALKKEGVHYADLFSVFVRQGEVLYHKRDSHWNNKGAALAAETLLDALERTHRSYQNADFEVKTDFEGDLDKMLYPLALTPEDEIYYEEPFGFVYVNEVESNFDPLIDTVSEAGAGGLLMYRDSFGNALLPFLAEEFETARFSRGVPYHLDDMFFCGADTVLVERAERFLPDMAQDPPVAQSPAVKVDLTESQDAGENETVCTPDNEGMYLKLSGRMDGKLLQTESKIYLRLDGEQIYEAYPMIFPEGDAFDDGGYVVYISKEKLEDTTGRVELFVSDANVIWKVYQSDLDFGIELYEE